MAKGLFVMGALLVHCSMADFYCDPVGGHDSNDGSMQAPFQTLHRAQEAVRGASWNPGSDLNVFLFNGVYRLTTPLLFGPADSGQGQDVHWQALSPIAQAGADTDGSLLSVQVSGGVVLSDWAKVERHAEKMLLQDCAADYASTTPCCGQGGGSVDPAHQCPAEQPTCVDYVYNDHWGHCAAASGLLWGSDVSHLKGKAQFRHLFVDGQRARRTVLSLAERDRAFAEAKTSADGYLVSSSLPLRWNTASRGAGVEFRYPQQGSPWTESHCAVDNVTDVGGGQSKIYLMQPCGFNLFNKPCGQGSKGPPAVVENVGIAYVTQPGQWLYDPIAQMVYVMSLPSENMNSKQVIMPILEQLVIASGASHIRFSGIAFAHSTWLRPHQGDGYVEQQSGACIIGTNPHNGDCDYDQLWQAPPAHLSLQGTSSITFDTCEFVHMGGVAVGLHGGAHFNAISGCYFHDISGAAIQVGDYDTYNLTRGEDFALREVDNSIVQSVFEGLGHETEFKGMCAIQVGYSQGTLIQHNDVSNLTYGAISVGWGWARKPLTYAANNTIAYNRVYNYKQELNDGGGIYMLGSQNGSVVHHNWLHQQGTSSSGALYPDEGSAYSRWHDNVVTDIAASEWLHLWTSSIHDIPVENNWADTKTYINKGTNCPMINNTVFDAQHVPAPAQAIMDQAGVQPSLWR